MRRRQLKWLWDRSRNCGESGKKAFSLGRTPAQLVRPNKRSRSAWRLALRSPQDAEGKSTPSPQNV